VNVEVTIFPLMGLTSHALHEDSDQVTEGMSVFSRSSLLFHFIDLQKNVQFCRCFHESIRTLPHKCDSEDDFFFLHMLAIARIAFKSCDSQNCSVVVL